MGHIFFFGNSAEGKFLYFPCYEVDENKVCKYSLKGELRQNSIEEISFVRSHNIWAVFFL